MPPDLLHISWNKLQHLVQSLAQIIQEDNYHPDILIAISRGGFIPARILCDQLGIQKLTCIQIEYYKGINDVKKEHNLIFPLNADINGLHVLIVDDVSDSGTSMFAAIDHIKNQGAITVKTSSIHIKPWTEYIPDYYSEKIDKWIIYPWEIIESLNELTQTLHQQGVSMENMKNELVKLGFNPLIVERFNLRR